MLGAESVALESSITKTQSFESGGVNTCIPEFAKVPIAVVEPSLGLNHQDFAVLLALVILLIFTVNALPLGM